MIPLFQICFFIFYFLFFIVEDVCSSGKLQVCNDAMTYYLQSVFYGNATGLCRQVICVLSNVVSLEQKYCLSIAKLTLTAIDSLEYYIFPVNF